MASIQAHKGTLKNLKPPKQAIIGAAKPPSSNKFGLFDVSRSKSKARSRQSQPDGYGSDSDQLREYEDADAPENLQSDDEDGDFQPERLPSGKNHLDQGATAITHATTASGAAAKTEVGTENTPPHISPPTSASASLSKSRHSQQNDFPPQTASAKYAVPDGAEQAQSPTNSLISPLSASDVNAPLFSFNHIPHSSMTESLSDDTVDSLPSSVELAPVATRNEAVDVTSMHDVIEEEDEDEIDGVRSSKKGTVHSGLGRSGKERHSQLLRSSLNGAELSSHISEEDTQSNAVENIDDAVSGVAATGDITSNGGGGTVLTAAGVAPSIAVGGAGDEEGVKSSAIAGTGAAPNSTTKAGENPKQSSAHSSTPPQKITADLNNAGKLATAIPMQHRDTKGYVTHDEDFFAKRELGEAHAQWYHIACWSLACIISAVFFSWNTGLTAGFGSFFIASALTGLAYSIMTCCLAEMASALPFSGGSYGFARATMGKAAGMFVGLAESLEYVLTTAVNMLIFGQICTQVFTTSIYLEILWVFIAYIISVAVHIYGQRTYWHITVAFTVIDLLIIALYWFGCIQFSNFSKNAPNPHSYPADALNDPANPFQTGYFIDGFTGFMTVLPISIWWYTGIEAMPLACEETIEPKENVPKGMIRGMTAVVIINIITFFIGVGVAVDIVPTSMGGLGQPSLIDSTFPMLAGFQQLFHASSYDSPLLSLIIVPAIFISAFGFVFAYGRQVYAMSRSGLLPACLSLVHEQYGTPHVSMIVGSAFGFTVCVIGRLAYPLSDQFENFKSIVYNCMLLVALINYIFQLACFIIIRTHYSMLTRKYRSPFGIAGACVGIAIFAFTLVALLGWNANIWQAIICITIYLGIGMLYYFLYSSKNMLLSPEEQVAMFMIYSINFLRKKQKDRDDRGGGKKGGKSSGKNKKNANEKEDEFERGGIHRAPGENIHGFELTQNMVQTIEKHGEQIRAKVLARQRRASEVKMKAARRALRGGMLMEGLSTAPTGLNTRVSGGADTLAGVGGTRLSGGRPLFAVRGNSSSVPNSDMTGLISPTGLVSPTSNQMGLDIVSLPGGTKSFTPKVLKLMGSTTLEGPLSNLDPALNAQLLEDSRIPQMIEGSTTQAQHLTVVTVPDQMDTQATRPHSVFNDALVTNIYVSTMHRRENPLDGERLDLDSTFSQRYIEDLDGDGGLQPMDDEVLSRLGNSQFLSANGSKSNWQAARSAMSRLTVSRRQQGTSQQSGLSGLGATSQASRSDMMIRRTLNMLRPNKNKAAAISASNAGTGSSSITTASAAITSSETTSTMDTTSNADAQGSSDPTSSNISTTGHNDTQAGVQSSVFSLPIASGLESSVLSSQYNDGMQSLVRQDSNQVQPSTLETKVVIHQPAEVSSSE